MPKLTQEQEQAVRQWAAEGANLNEIQDRLKSEHDLTLTYFEARMLVVDLDLKLQEKKRDLIAQTVTSDEAFIQGLTEAELQELLQ